MGWWGCAERSQFKGHDGFRPRRGWTRRGASPCVPSQVSLLPLPPLPPPPHIRHAPPGRGSKALNCGGVSFHVKTQTPQSARGDKWRKALYQNILNI
eukprot:2232276-Pyramimonas_sp.AAC.1